MRKTSYVVTFFAVAFTMVLNILSTIRHDWLFVKTDVLHVKTTISYGLMERCELRVVDPQGSSVINREYNCRTFPAGETDHCDKENRSFCIAWTSAGYLTELGAGFAALALFSLVIGVTTHSRRRRIWRAVAVMIIFHAVLQIMAFAIVNYLYHTSRLPTFEEATPSTAYFLNLLSWAFGIIIVFAVITTGVSADKGHRWAAGNRAYRPIPG